MEGEPSPNSITCDWRLSGIPLIPLHHMGELYIVSWAIECHTSMPMQVKNNIASKWVSMPVDETLSSFYLLSQVPTTISSICLQSSPKCGSNNLSKQLEQEIAYTKVDWTKSSWWKFFNGWNLQFPCDSSWQKSSTIDIGSLESFPMISIKEGRLKLREMCKRTENSASSWNILMKNSHIHEGKRSRT